MPFTQCGPFLEVLEDISKHLGHNGANFFGNLVFQFLYKIHQRSKNAILKITPKEIVRGTEVWTPLWPDVRGIDAIDEKGARRLESLGCGVYRCPILLKPAVSLFRLQQGNKLGYKIA